MSTSFIKTQDFVLNYLNSFEKFDSATKEKWQDVFTAIFNCENSEEALTLITQAGGNVLRPQNPNSLAYTTLKKGAFVFWEGDGGQSIIGLVTKQPINESDKARVVVFTPNTMFSVAMTANRLRNLQGIVDVNVPANVAVKGVVKMQELGKVVGNSLFKLGDYNPNNQVIRIGKISQGITHYDLLDNNLQNIIYDASEQNNTGSIKLPIGAKIIKLNEHPSNNGYQHILIWWKGRYREGYIIKQALDNPIEYNGTFDEVIEVFVNDVEHLLARVKNRGSVKNDTQFKPKVIDNIETIFDSIKNDITKPIMDAVRQEYYDYFKYEGDKVEFLNRLSTSFFDAFGIGTDYNTGSEKMRETVLHLSLSYDWFASDIDLLAYYNNVLCATVNGHEVYTYFKNLGIIGDTIQYSNPTEVQKILNLLNDLKIFVDSKPNIVGDEKIWLDTVNTNKTTSIVALFKDFWSNCLDKPYEQYVGTSASFGHIKVIPQLQTLIHETNVASYGFGNADTHIASSTNQRLFWIECCNNNFLQLQSSLVNESDPKFVDSLYLSHDVVEAISLLILLRRIYAKLHP